MSKAEAKQLLEVRDLVKHFPITKGIILARQVGAVKAVDGVSFSVKKGETLGVVGESGCGKTTTGRLILRLVEATSGDIIFEGKNIRTLPKDQMREIRKDIQIIFQDPYASLNPRMTVGDIIGEPLYIHKLARGKEKEKRVRELLEVVGLSSFHARRFPHEFSGGQRQRIGVARALAVNPIWPAIHRPTPESLRPVHQEYPGELLVNYPQGSRKAGGFLQPHL